MKKDELIATGISTRVAVAENPAGIFAGAPIPFVWNSHILSLIAGWYSLASWSFK